MKRLSMLLAAGFATLVLVACGAVPTQTAAAVQVQIGKACAVAVPTLADLQAMQAPSTSTTPTAIDKMASDTQFVCAASATVDTTSLSDLVQTAIPAAIQVVTASSLPQDKKTAIQIGLLAFQTALSAALAQYGTPSAPAAPAPASAPLAA
jgi:hypothetical protein